MAKKQTVTLASMLAEMGTWIDTSKWIPQAEKSGISTDNSPRLRQLVQSWINGNYDEDPEILVQELTYLLPLK